MDEVSDPKWNRVISPGFSHSTPRGNRCAKGCASLLELPIFHPMKDASWPQWCRMAPTLLDTFAFLAIKKVFPGLHFESSSNPLLKPVIVKFFLLEAKRATILWVKLLKRASFRSPPTHTPYTHLQGKVKPQSPEWVCFLEGVAGN